MQADWGLLGLHSHLVLAFGSPGGKGSQENESGGEGGGGGGGGGDLAPRRCSTGRKARAGVAGACDLGVWRGK